METRLERTLGRARPLPLVRAVIGAEIERLIAMLDAIDPDPDLEPWLTSEDGGSDDREDDNEHGGDIQDEPHDEEPAEEDALHFLCDWSDDPDTPQDGCPWWGLSCLGAQAGATSEARL